MDHDIDTDVIISTDFFCRLLFCFIRNKNDKEYHAFVLTFSDFFYLCFPPPKSYEMENIKTLLVSKTIYSFKLLLYYLTTP